MAFIDAFRTLTLRIGGPSLEAYDYATVINEQKTEALCSDCWKASLRLRLRKMGLKELARKVA